MGHVRADGLNVSQHDDQSTASTCEECAEQRADNLAVMGARTVLELCVGPSLRSLQRAYSRRGISVVGNDIEARWSHHFPAGSWIVGDALRIAGMRPNFDAMVFAPPLSVGCSGRREDSLSIERVTPGYDDFLRAAREFRGIKVLVLPARSTATRHDRKQLHRLLSALPEHELVPLTSGRRRIVKYHDVYIPGTKC